MLIRLLKASGTHKVSRAGSVSSLDEGARGDWRRMSPKGVHSLVCRRDREQ